MSKACILVIEDDPDIQELVIVSFAREGWTVLAAEDGEKGLALLASSMPDCIILDIMLPGMDGLEVLSQIRADERTRRQPVVILTTSSEEEDIARSYDMGANSYIRKPVDFNQFAEAVQHLGLYWLVLNEPAPPKKE